MMQKLKDTPIEQTQINVLADDDDEVGFLRIYTLEVNRKMLNIKNDLGI